MITNTKTVNALTLVSLRSAGRTYWTGPWASYVNAVTEVEADQALIELQAGRVYKNGVGVELYAEDCELTEGSVLNRAGTCSPRMARGLAVGDKFQMGHLLCDIKAIDQYRGTPHYEVLYQGDDGNYHHALMPCEFAINFAGYPPV